MNRKDKFLTYRGEIKAIAGQGRRLVFATLHPEEQPAGVYFLDAETHKMTQKELPCGAVALAVDAETVFAAGANGAVFDLSAKGAPVLLPHKFDATPVALALVKSNHLAVLLPKSLAVISCKDGTLQQTVPLPENELGTCLSVDFTGRFLAVGTTKGTVMVLEAEAQEAFQTSDSKQLHSGPVTALMFEKETARFYSAGQDTKLLVTHARGVLEPEDRSKGAAHAEQIAAMVQGAKRLYTGSSDKTIKAWPASGRPSTHSEGVAKITALTTVDIYSQSHLAAVCSDNSIRIFTLDAAGKPGDTVCKYRDAYAQAKAELQSSDPAGREAALKCLAGYGDYRGLEIIAESITSEMDAGIRLAAAKLLSKAEHPKTAALLEAFIGHKDEAVRLCVFNGLISHLQDVPFRPVDLALAVKKKDVGLAAVEQLKKLSDQIDREKALARLEQALNLEPFEVRRAALFALEKIYPQAHPGADLAGLQSIHWDIRRLALIRFLQRNMLAQPLVGTALRNFMEDPQAEVRQAAFLLLIATRKNLINRLRSDDPDLHRKFFELENYEQKHAAEISKPPKSKVELAADDYDPLLKAMSCLQTDIALEGAFIMARLGDLRAFGLLMQLSRDKNSKIRSDVCHALFHLNDHRSVKRLRVMIQDQAADVRDAAFSALARLYDREPLTTVASGLSIHFEDVRRRALEILIRFIRKTPKREKDTVRKLLVKALNDDAAAVRGEAFKAVFNLSIDDSREESLKFALNSIYADIRKNVLLEVVAVKDLPWALPLLTGFFNDPEKTLRSEAFGYSLGKKKKADQAVLSAGMASSFADIRLETIAALTVNFSDFAEELLFDALSDADKTVRRRALQVLIEKGGREVLPRAIKSAHSDIRSRAAEIAAGLGDKEALPQLLALLAENEPEGADPKKEWLVSIQIALRGLGRLGDPDAVDHVAPFLAHENSTIRSAAVETLIRVSRNGRDDALRQALKHSDKTVRIRAALGLAYCGNATAERILASKEASKLITAREQLIAAFILDGIKETAADGTPQQTIGNTFDRLLVFMDRDNSGPGEKNLKRIAFLILMLSELYAKEDEPQRAIALLCARDSAIRLRAAQALESICDEFDAFLIELVNAREDKSSWGISIEEIRLIGRLICHGPLHLKVAAIEQLFYLEEKQQTDWDNAWEVYTRRYQDEIALLSPQTGTASGFNFERDQLLNLAFGAYVGLIRDQGGSTSQNVALAGSAMGRIYRLASNHPAFAKGAESVFLHTLANPNKEIRLKAFEYLSELGMDGNELGGEALRVGHKDLGILGLKTLTRNTTETAANELLLDVVVQRKDGLEIDAAGMLSDRIGRPAVSESALTAASENLRRMAVQWLTADYDAQEDAQKVLRKATRSKFAGVRLEAALALGGKKDPQAFDALAALLETARGKEEQQRLVNAIDSLKDDRTPELLLHRMESDPPYLADSASVLKCVGNYRQAKRFDRLMQFFRKPEYRPGAFDAMYRTTGFDRISKRIEPNYHKKDGFLVIHFKTVVEHVTDPDTQLTLAQGRKCDRWCRIGDSLGFPIPEETYLKIHSDLEKKFSLNVGLLVSLLSACITMDASELCLKLAGSSMSVKENAVDSLLAVLAGHGDSALRILSLNVIGFRVRHRNGPVQPLIAALSHKDPVTKFVAAEVLAKSKRLEGFNVLLAAIDLMDDLDYRCRAVGALGELGDEKALDLLLRIADDEAHALQQAALEAIGRMGRGDQAEKIFTILKRFAAPRPSDGYTRAYEYSNAALSGLCWLNTAESWEFLRSRAADTAYDFFKSFRKKAIELLAYNSDPATVDLLLHLIEKDDNHALTAYDSAKKILGDQSLDAEYALLQQKSGAVGRYNIVEKVAERVAENGRPEKIFAILHNCTPDIQKALMVGLMRRKPLPVDAAVAALKSPFESTMAAAARMAGRCAVAEEMIGKEIETALSQWMEKWRKERRNLHAQDDTGDGILKQLTSALVQLIWAAGKHGAAEKIVVETVAAGMDDPYFTLIRKSALAALTNYPPSAESAAALHQVVLNDGPDLRREAAFILRTFHAAITGAIDVARISDRQCIVALKAHGDMAEIRKAMRNIHYQGAVIRSLLENNDVAGISAIATDGGLSEVERKGAVEALAGTCDPAAEAALIAVGEDSREEEELRKSAWKALRRLRRVRTAAG